MCEIGLGVGVAVHLMKITERRVVVDILHLRDRGYYYAVIIARRLQVNPKSKEHPFVLFISKLQRNRVIRVLGLEHSLSPPRVIQKSSSARLVRKGTIDR
jgi:hypothetical protein